MGTARFHERVRQMRFEGLWIELLSGLHGNEADAACSRSGAASQETVGASQEASAAACSRHDAAPGWVAARFVNSVRRRPRRTSRT